VEWEFKREMGETVERLVTDFLWFTKGRGVFSKILTSRNGLVELSSRLPVVWLTKYNGNAKYRIVLQI